MRTMLAGMGIDRAAEKHSSLIRRAQEGRRGSRLFLGRRAEDLVLSVRRALVRWQDLHNHP